MTPEEKGIELSKLFPKRRIVIVAPGGILKYYKKGKLVKTGSGLFIEFLDVLGSMFKRGKT